MPAAGHTADVASATRADLTSAAVAGAVTAAVLVSLLWVPEYGYRYWFSWAKARCGALMGLVVLISAGYGTVLALLATWGGFTVGHHGWLAGFFTAAAGVLVLRTRRGGSHAPAPAEEDGDPSALTRITHGVVERSLGRLQQWLDRTARTGAREWVSGLDDEAVLRYWASIKLDGLRLPSGIGDYSDTDRAKQRALLDAVNDHSADNVLLRRADLRKLIVAQREGKREIVAYSSAASRRRRARR